MCLIGCIKLQQYRMVFVQMCSKLCILICNSSGNCNGYSRMLSIGMYMQDIAIVVDYPLNGLAIAIILWGPHYYYLLVLLTGLLPPS
jgi:hypothetical protein